ncbi:hypothetical protein DH2020_010429 [Rehmannia glutinosa]|uniref:Mitochondrial glycoprotein n=1 Tax=Rehmannia glutinosa TaxID=99300 RepID=A0ABR0XBC6_REHGL
MALNNVIRTASRVVPLAIRASTGRLGYLHHHHSFQQPRGRTLRKSVSEVISLISPPGEEVPQGFPFKIEDHPGQQTIMLSREYQGETISVEVHMPDLVTGEDNDDNDNDDEEGEEKGNQSSIPLVVRISKKSGPCLEFGCTAYPDEIAIENLSVKDPENSEDQIAYEGPDFGDLDENLQKAFHKYLEIRGIKPSTTNFLHGYMIDKGSREYITWLKNLQKFVQA